MAKTFTAAEKEAYKEQRQAEQRELLRQAIDNLTSSEGWQTYLDTRARFWKYSVSNVILIALQAPHATSVMGAGARNGKTGWKSLDRRVKEDEFRTNAIKILAPQIVYEKENGKFVLDSDGNKVVKLVWYKTVDVYDVSQTEGEPLPIIEPEPVTGESHEEYLYRAEQYITSMGADVEYGITPFHWIQGNASRKLTASIDATKAINEQTRELIRACASIIGNDHFAGMDTDDFPTPQEQEVIIESAAYLACRNVNLDTAGLTVPHIAKWGVKDDDPKGALKSLTKFAKIIDDVTFQVTEAIS
jgi:hypothetical protein